MSAATRGTISLAGENDAQALAIRTNLTLPQTARQGFVSVAGGFSLRRLGTCGLALPAWHSRFGTCGLALAAWHVRLGTCGLALAAWHLRLGTCGLALPTRAAFPAFLVARSLTKLLQFREMWSCKFEMRLRTAVVILPLMNIALCGRAAARFASLLPTQQRVRVAGKDVPLGLFPSGMALSSDGRLIVASNNGFLFQSLTTVDTDTLKTKDTRVGNSTGSDVVFIGVALSPDGRTVYASGHDDFGNDGVHTATIAPGPQLTFGARITLTKGSFPAGMAMSTDGKRLYVAENLAGMLAVIDMTTRAVLTEIPVGRLPWGVAVHPSLPQVYVANRADRTLSIVDTETMEVIATVPTGNGPNAVAVCPNGAKIFVANASSDDLTVFDVNHPESARQISLSPFPGARPGSSPNALACSPDNTRLYVANACDNAVAVVSPEDETEVGMIPTGWYPSAVAVSPDNRTLYITNMKGARTYPRTRRRQPMDFSVNRNFGGTYGVRGTLQVVPV